jgi:hypothetical protein
LILERRYQAINIQIEMVFTRLVGLVGGSATFAQIFLALPMTLDLLGTSPRDFKIYWALTAIGAPSFLLLSLLVTIHHFLYSTIRLFLKNTPLAPLVAFLSILSPFFTTLCIATTLYYYLHPPDSTSTGGLLPGASHALVNVMPYMYANVLRWVSPLFTLAEGISTLLVIQVVGKVGKGWADEEEKEEGIEWRGLLGLVAAALVYCAGLAGIIRVSAMSAYGLMADQAGVPQWSGVVHPGIHARRCAHDGPLPVFNRLRSSPDQRARNESSLCLRRRKLVQPLQSDYRAEYQYSAWLSGVEAEME